MRASTARLGVGLATLVLLGFPWGCTTVPVAREENAATRAGAVNAGNQVERGWWTARFRLLWPPETEPRWDLDARLAHQVVAPVLREFQDRIELWRFHRRARRDAAGHQFSWMFYTTADTADRIFCLVQNSQALRELRSAGLVIEDGYDSTALVKRPGIADTSDPQWSEAVRDAWPWFIMGVSRTWLDLVERLTEQARAAGHCRAGPDACYREVHQRLQQLWRDQGGHAFLHHLNALFGYQPTLVYEQRLMTF